MTVLRCAFSRLAASEGHFWTEATYLQQTRSFQSRNERLSVGLGRIWSKREKSDSAEPPAGTRDNVAFNLPRRVREKVVTASDAVSLVRNGDTIAVTGFVAQGKRTVGADCACQGLVLHPKQRVGSENC